MNSEMDQKMEINSFVGNSQCSRGLGLENGNIKDDQIE